jgi:signal recognition particle receptor subunit beta
MENLGITWIVLLTIAIGICGIFLFSRFGSKNSKRRDQILFVGPRFSGKTMLTRKLAYNIEPVTAMSAEASVLQGEDIQMKYAIVDFPGHPKLRHQLHSYLPRAVKIVFVFDASNTQNQLRDAAEYIYDLFTNPEIDGCSSMIVACNKSDVQGARPCARIKLALQQELEKIKLTRKSLEDGEDDNYIPLGRENQPFSFDQDSPIGVEFMDISAKKGPLDGLKSVIES